MILLGLDIGTKRTGVAYADTSAGFVMALDTIHHTTVDELLARVVQIANEKKASEIIVGLPRLPQGDEGSQATFVRSVVESLKAKISVPLTLVDERYSSYGAGAGTDPDAKAACEMLSLALDMRKKGY